VPEWQQQLVAADLVGLFRVPEWQQQKQLVAADLEGLFRVPEWQ
jgi:glucose uptake protein GlcU